MKLIKIYSLFLICIAVYSCQNSSNSQESSIDNTQTETSNNDVDTRPKEQIYFLNRVLADNDYDIRSNAILKDKHVKAFDAYAQDSLKNIKNWEFIVAEINDNEFFTNTFFSRFGDPNDKVYNLELLAPIKIDNSVDTIAVDNMVNFIFTIPKEPKGKQLKKILSTIQSLAKDDVVIISGALTNIDNDLKVNFAPLFDKDLFEWKMDVLITDIRKKVTN